MSHPDDSVNIPVTADSEPAALGQALRQRAETLLETLDARGMDTFTPVATDRLVYELRVHQIELELQNEELRRAQESMDVLQARYFGLYDLAPVGYLTLSEAGLIQEANRAAATFLNALRGDLVDQPITRFILDEDQAVYAQCRNQLWSGEEPQTAELRLLCLDNATRWVRLEASLTPEVTGGVPLWRVILSDITDRKRSDHDLFVTQARLRLVAEIADLTFWEWNPRTNRVSFPSPWQQQMGYPADELPTHLADWSTLLHPEDRERILNRIKHFVDAPTTPYEIQYRLQRKDGVYRWFVALLEAILDDRDHLDHVLLVNQDVTRHKESEDRALHLAQHDPLTGLPSRALLDQIANHMLASAHRSGSQLAVLFFDLDHFKAINDTHGHRIGDLLLQAVARRLLDAFREEDLVGRLGGDEFVAVLANIRNDADAASAARTAIAALTPAYLIEGHALHCVSSLGISLFPRDGTTIEHLIQCADLAMYHAKQISPGQSQFASQ